MHIEVTDDGRGTAPDHRPGMGVTSIRERCLELGGRAAITAATPHGTVVRRQLPIAVPAAGTSASTTSLAVNVRA